MGVITCMHALTETAVKKRSLILDVKVFSAVQCRVCTVTV